MTLDEKILVIIVYVGHASIPYLTETQDIRLPQFAQ